MAVTANQLIQQSEDCKVSAPVAASTRLYQGTLVYITAAGYADDDTATGANYFGGLSVADVDNSSGAAGALSAELLIDGVFTVAGSGFTQALVGNKAYGVDNFTVSGTSTNNTLIGYFTEYLSATAMRVRFRTGEA